MDHIALSAFNSILLPCKRTKYQIQYRLTGQRKHLSTIQTTDVGNGREAIGRKKTVFENEYRAADGKVAHSEWCASDEAKTHSVPAAFDNVDLHKPREFRDLVFHEEKLNVREYAVEQIVCSRQRNGKKHFIHRWYGYRSNEDKVEPPEHVLNHFIARIWRLICK